MQFQVPQFIEAENKIVGPLTMRQFLFIAGALALSLVLYYVISAILLWFFFSAIIVSAGIALALVKVNGQPLPRVFVAAVNYFWKPQTYVWQPEHPAVKKDLFAFASLIGSRTSFEDIVAGFALRNARERVQLGTRSTQDTARRAIGNVKEKYEIIRHLTGEREAARRVDFR